MKAPHLLIFFFVFALFAAAGAPHQAYAATAPSGFEIDTVAAGLTLPTSFAFAPDGRVFIAEKSGTILEVKNGVLQATPVVVLPDVNDYGDRGVEGIAVDPNFAQNGYIYVAYTYENSPNNYTGPKTGRIARLTVVGDTASLASRVVILGTVGGDAADPSCSDFATTSDCIPSDSSAHSMGGLRFGPDGKLYASIGDGSGYLTVDPEALNAQNIQSLGGKMLRINTDGTASSDNPFYDGNPNDNQSKIWILGDRNMYRFSFRPSDGALFIGAVGWATWESIDIGQKGADYGWPCIEGFATTTYDCTTTYPPTYPIYVYDHSAGSASVIGGVFPSAYPQYAGNYFFGDYSQNYIKRMVLNSDNTVASVSSFITNAGGPVDIQEGPDGNLWYVAIDTGELQKVVYSSAAQPPAAAITAAPTQGQAPLTVQFSGSKSVSPDGSALTYQWDFGDGTSGSGETVSHTYTANGTYIAALTVTNAAGLQSSSTAQIAVGTVQTGVPSPSVVSETISPSPTHVGDDTTLTATIANQGDAAPFIVDLEIYNSGGTQVAQKIFEGTIIPTGQSAQFSMQWLPPGEGAYTAKVGLFKEGWTGLYQWNNDALDISVLARNPATTSPPSFSQSTSVVPNLTVGTTDTVTTTIHNTGGATNALVDLEVYQNGTKVGQQFFDNQSFAANSSQTYTYAYPIPASGAYTVSVGVFTPGWGSLYNWFGSPANFTAASVGGSATLYQDSLAGGWENWSWGSTQNFADTSAPLAGSDSLHVSYTAAWGGLFLHTVGVNTTGLSTLTFAIRGSGKVQIYAFDSNGAQSPTVPLTTYLPGGITSSWQTVSIPLADLNLENKTLTGIIIQDASGNGSTSINLDEIVLQ